MFQALLHNSQMIEPANDMYLLIQSEKWCLLSIYKDLSGQNNFAWNIFLGILVSFCPLSAWAIPSIALQSSSFPPKKTTIKQGGKFKTL